MHFADPIPYNETANKPSVVTAISRDRIYEIVRKIPRGKVATYGQVAILAGMRGHARQVGYALAALPPDVRVPWHRVINAKGCVSIRVNGQPDERQRQLLERERVEFDVRGRVSLARYQWRTSSLHD